MKTLFGDEFESDLATLHETSLLLGVSAATVRNWVKHEFLAPVASNGKTTFERNKVLQLKEQIANGQIDRLTRRANKSRSVVLSVPEEHSTNAHITDALYRILDLYRSHNLALRATLSAVMVATITQRGLGRTSSCGRLDASSIRHKGLRDEVQWWIDKADRDETLSHLYLELQHFSIPEHRDFLGILYQTLRDEGTNSRHGSYYTPQKVVEQVVAEHLGPDAVVLDPCCGTGQFLLAAAEIVSDPLSLWGFEIDEIAARIARLNLLTRFINLDFTPNIYCLNTLLTFSAMSIPNDLKPPKFDLVFTNPPWGTHFSVSELALLQKLYPEVRSNEAFSYFLSCGLQFLRDGGTLSYLLPEAVLNVKAHSDIRQVISLHTRITKVEHLGRIFKTVFTPVVRLDLVNSRPDSIHSFTMLKDGENSTVEQSRLAANSDFRFDIFARRDDLSIFQKMFERDHLTLKGNAEWALGVVTGDNARFLSDRCLPGFEPILTGKEICRFVTRPARKFIQFAPEQWQQVAPIERYRYTEKLLYKFISNELVFAYDSRSMLSLNSANVLIPKIPSLSTKAILGFLNSNLYQLLFQKKFGALKVLRGDVEQLPFPLLSDPEQQTIVGFVDRLLEHRVDPKQELEVYIGLNEHIMGLFSLTHAERDYVRENSKISPKTLGVR